MSPSSGSVETALASAFAAHVDHVVTAYATAAQRAGYDALALHAGAPALVNRFDDRHHPLSITPAFAHVAPIAEPDTWIVIRPGERPRLIRIVVDDFWEAPPPAPPDFVLAAFDVVLATPAQVHSLLPRGRTAYVSRDPAALDAPAADVNPPALVAALGAPGEFPFTRGVQPTMYRGQLW